MARAQEEISSREFVEWRAFFSLEPFGSQVEDLRNGVLAALMVNLWGKKEGEESAKPDDFLFVPLEPEEVDEEAKELSLEDKLVAAFRNLGMRDSGGNPS